MTPDITACHKFSFASIPVFHLNEPGKLIAAVKFAVFSEFTTVEFITMILFIINTMPLICLAIGYAHGVAFLALLSY